MLVNHNGASCLPAALAALAHNTDCDDVEGIVVDSGSADGSWLEVERHWPAARALRFENNIGFCAGCNRGAEAAGGRLVAFVNFDGQVEPGWDVPLRELLGDPEVSVATGLLLKGASEEIEAAGLEIAPNMATFGRQDGEPRGADPQGPREVTAASGALMMVRREEFLALGGFYEPLFMYGEEADYCLRVPGRVLLDTASVLRHDTGQAAGPSRSATRLYWPSRNRLINAARHLPPGALVRSVLASAAFDLLTLAQLRRREALTAMARGWADGLRAMRHERRARDDDDRRQAAQRLVSLREAVSEQRRLGRV